MIRITKITEKYQNLIFEDAETIDPTVEETPSPEGETTTEETTDTTNTSEYQAGDIVVYLYKGKTMDDWNALTDEEKTNLEEKPASDVVNVKKIEKIEGDKYYFKDKEGNDFTKNVSDIVQKQTPPEEVAAEQTTEEPTEEPTADTTDTQQAQNVTETFEFTSDVIKFNEFFEK